MTRHRSLRWQRAVRYSITTALVLAMRTGIRPDDGLAAEADPAGQLIRRAGNADDDAVRLQVLTTLQKTAAVDPSVRRDAGHMAAAVQMWITSKQLPYFGGQVARTRDFDFKIAEDSPLYPITCIYRGRMLTWVTLESGGIIRQRDRRRQFLDKAVDNFRVAEAAFPQNRIVRMYLGRPIPCRREYPAVESAPRWAALQRENLQRLTEVIHWWIDHRLQADGQYGGGWGDDCEMWRWWVPVMIGFDDPKITRAQARFSDALMGQPHMAGGYTARMSDVEHTAEDSADVITPMMHLEPDDPLWKGRALRTAELMEKLWTGRNRRGQLQFKSTYFTVDRLDADPQRACDTVYHPRAVQPALLYWQRTGEKRLERLFTDWMDTWVDATARAQRGKPAGIVPSAIHWPEGDVGGLGPNWWDPRNHGETTLYEWPSAARMMTDTMLLCWHMTGDEKYLQPLRSMAAIRLKWLKQPPQQTPVPGSEAWCAAKLGFLSGTLAKYRLLSAGSEFDELLERDHRSLMLSGPRADRTALTAALRDSAQALRVNFEGYTSEVRYTDRVLRFPAIFGGDMMFPEAIPSIKTPNPSLLYSTVTGDPGDCGYLPLNAVRWLTPPSDVAALVTESARDRFTAELFHFGEEKRPMAAELYLLAPRRYVFEVVEKATGAVIKRPTPFAVAGPRTRIELELPGQRLCELRVRPRT